MKGYKAFEKGLVCKGKQYAENTVFEEEKAEICKSGMHFCENPLDCLDYYPLIDDKGNMTEFAEVEALDEPKTDDNKKFASKKLKIGAKLDLAGFIKASIKFVWEKCTKDIEKDSGDSAKLASSGDYAQLASSGNYAKLASSGDYAKLASSGYSAQLASSGDYAQLASSGYSAKLASSGDSAQLASSGNYAQLASSGNSAQLASSGDYAKLASSGNYAQLASSGDSAQLASSGYSAKLASSGDSAQVDSKGKYAVICCAGNNSVARGKIGSWITLSEWEWSKEEDNYIPVCVKTKRIDGVKIKEDTFYRLVNGKFVEVK